MMSEINWQQKRKVYRNAEGETYVKVATGFMELSDYVGEGGPGYL